MLYSKNKGRYEKEYRELWDSLVPQSGQANTIQGELVRVIGRLASECYRNGNANWNRGFRIYTNFLARHLTDERIFDAQALSQIKEDLQTIRKFGSDSRTLKYSKEEDEFDRITDRVVEWCQNRPEPIERKINPKLKR